ncbi:MAG TPA: hypothetical protein EYP20_00595 [Aigarchaeota archaeon]|nr:hypothetical protein [Aigarchaeota archaeon]
MRGKVQVFIENEFKGYFEREEALKLAQEYKKKKYTIEDYGVYLNIYKKQKPKQEQKAKKNRAS